MMRRLLLLAACVLLLARVALAALPFADNFNRPDGGLGANWTTVLNNPDIASNQATATLGGGATNTARITSETFTDDQEISALIVAPLTSQNAGLILQADGTHQYVLVFNDADTKMYRLVNTTYTQIGSAYTAVTAGQTATFRDVADSLKFLINGVQDGSSQAGGGSYTGGTPGIWLFGSGSYLDNVSANNVAGVGGTVCQSFGALGVGCR